MKKRFIIYNGLIRNADDNIFNADNRAFLYADGFFESIFAYNEQIPFLNLHFKRINEAISAFGMETNPIFTDLNELKNIIVFLARKNKLYKAYRIRITIFRNSGGLYLPNDNTISYIIQTKPLDIQKPVPPLDGLKVDIYNDVYKDFSLISKFKTINSIPVISALYAKQNNLDDVILLNHDQNIVETSNSNIFLFIDNKLYTPKISDGPVQGIMRQVVIDIAGKMDVDLIETSLTVDKLFEAQEFILTNSISGVRFVNAFRDKRYLNIFANKLYSKIIETFFNY